MKKLTYKDVVEEIRVIHLGNGGYEYISSDPYGDGKFDFQSKSTWERDDKAGVRAANKCLSEWKKGLRRLIKISKNGPGAFTKMGNGYTGNGAQNNNEYFWQLYKNLTHTEIMELSDKNKTFKMVSYVNGSIDITIN